VFGKKEIGMHRLIDRGGELVPSLPYATYADCLQRRRRRRQRTETGRGTKKRGGRLRTANSTMTTRLTLEPFSLC